MEIQHEAYKNSREISLYLRLICKKENNNLSDYITSTRLLKKISKITNSENISFIYNELNNFRSTIDDSKSNYNKYIKRKIDKINSKNSVKIRKMYLRNINCVYIKELKYTSKYLDTRISNIASKYSQDNNSNKISFSNSNYSKLQTFSDCIKYSSYNIQNHIIKKILYPFFIKKDFIMRNFKSNIFYIIHNFTNKLQYLKYINLLSNSKDDLIAKENMKNCMHLKKMPEHLKKNLKLIYYNHDTSIKQKTKNFKATLEQELRMSKFTSYKIPEAYTFEVHRITGNKNQNSYFIFNYFNNNEELIKSSKYSFKDINNSLNIHSKKDYLKNRTVIIKQIINELSEKNAGRDILSELHLNLCFEFNCEKLNPYILYMLNKENLVEYAKIYIEQEMKHKGTKIPITYYPNSNLNYIKRTDIQYQKSR